MKEYPSISAKIQRDLVVYAFDKLDGSNIRAEWNKKNGFYKFGSRHVLIDETAILGPAIPLVKSIEEAFMKIASKNRMDRGVAFFEYHGPNSFAGNHLDSDEKKVSLIDVIPYKSSNLNPDEFIDLFSEFDIPKLVYRGTIGQEVEDGIRNRTLPGITFEGVVCKSKKRTKTAQMDMFKVKTYDWLKRLKDYCNGDEKLYKILE